MLSGTRLFLSFSNKPVKSPTETAPLSRATVRLLLARHLVLRHRRVRHLVLRHRRVRHLILRHRVVHSRLVLLRLGPRRGVALRVVAVHLVGAELHAVVLRVVDLRGEAPRRAVVASRRVDAGWQADVVLVVDEVPPVSYTHLTLPTKA